MGWAGRRALLCAWFALTSGLLGCEPSTATVACNTNDDCPQGLACRHGVCEAVARDSGAAADRGAVDGAAADAGAGDHSIAPDRAAPDSGQSDRAQADATRPDASQPDLTGPDRGLAVDASPAPDTARPDVVVDSFVPDPTPLTAVELCAIFNSYFSNGSYCYQQPLITGLDLSDELDRLCRPGSAGHSWGLDVLAASDEGRISVDWVQARECLTRSRAMRQDAPAYALLLDPAWAALQEGVCTSFYTGAVGSGGACRENWDCLSAQEGCYSDQPTQAGSLRCRAPQGQGGRCSNYLPCADHLYCNNGICSPRLADGQPCDVSYGSYQCLSGSCPAGVCEAVPDPVAMGAACSEGDSCAGSCASCRPAQAGGALACRLLGAEGQYCRNPGDCLTDLGCTDNTCTTVGDGEVCGYQTESRCEPGLTCASQVNCMAFNSDQAACTAEAPDCVYDATFNTCNVAQGTCVADPPTSGNCLFGHLCAESHYCRAATTTCEPRAQESQTCADDGVAAPPCLAALRCIDGSCRYGCEFRQDCAPDGYCDTSSGTCQPLAPASCSSSQACPDGQYCDTAVNTCYDRLDVGALCQTADQCSSGVCLTLDSGQARCAVEQSGGCLVRLYDAAFLRAAFLLGAVFFTVRLGRRRGELG